MFNLELTIFTQKYYHTTTIFLDMNKCKGVLGGHLRRPESMAGGTMEPLYTDLEISDRRGRII